MSHAETHALPGMTDDNVRLAKGAGEMVSNVLLGAGAVGILGAIVAGVAGVTEVKHAKISLLVGIAATLAVSVGGLFFTMIFHLTNAGWSATVRRQFENLMATMWVPGLLMIVFIGSEFFFGGKASSWLDPEITQNGTEHLFVGKQPYLSVGFASVRALVYVLILTFLVRRLWYFSTEQDRTGDRWLSNRARFLSAWGVPVAALTTTFFAFDWMMALTDYTFYSTMWGVYFFAGSAYAVIASVILIFALLKRAGKLEDGVVGPEHLHDLSKLFFGFTVFWAYIAFGQYFLIWYSNIPEETAWFVHRKIDYAGLTFFLVLGHFILPFFILLWRYVRRTWTVIAAMAVWALFTHIIDIYWILRPAVYIGSLLESHETPAGYVVDVVAIGGVVALYAGMVMKRVARGPLVPLHDPRLPEALHHRNYV